MYVITAILYAILLILAIFAWRLHNTWFQAVVSIIGVGWLTPLYRHISSGWVEQHGGWDSESSIGWCFLSAIGTVVTISLIWFLLKSIGDYLEYADPRKYPNITLKEYNHFLTINPDAWAFPVYATNRKGEVVETYVYRVKNTRIDEQFVMSYWEYMWLRLTRALDVDMRSRLYNVHAKARLADAAQKDLDKLQEENQKRLQQSLKNIEKMKKSHSDLIRTYGDHLQTYEDPHIQLYGEGISATAQQVSKEKQEVPQ